MKMNFNFVSFIQKNEMLGAKAPMAATSFWKRTWGSKKTCEALSFGDLLNIFSRGFSQNEAEWESWSIGYLREDREREEITKKRVFLEKRNDKRRIFY